MHREARSLEGFASQWYTEGLFFGCFTLFSVYFVIFLLITSKWSHTVSLQNIEEQIALEQVAFSMVYDRTREPSSETVCSSPWFFFQNDALFCYISEFKQTNAHWYEKTFCQVNVDFVASEGMLFFCVKIAYLSIFGDFKNRVFWVPDFFKKIRESKNGNFCYDSWIPRYKTNACSRYKRVVAKKYIYNVFCCAWFGLFDVFIFWNRMLHMDSK